MLLYIWLHRGPQYLYLSVHFQSPDMTPGIAFID